MTSCGYCGAARVALKDAAKAFVRGDLRGASVKINLVKENVEAKIKSESDRIRRMSEGKR